MQRIQNVPNTLEQEEQNRTHISQFQSSISIGISYIKGQWTFNKHAKTIRLGKDILQQIVLEQLDHHMQKNEVEILSHTTYKN